jgi:hypothetical protein
MLSMLLLILERPKCEIFNRSDFHDFYTIFLHHKVSMGGGGGGVDFGVKKKFF